MRPMHYIVPSQQVQAQLLTPHSHIQPLKKALLLTESARGAHRTLPRTQANPPTRAEVHPCIAILHFCTHAPAQHCSCIRSCAHADKSQSEPHTIRPTNPYPRKGAGFARANPAHHQCSSSATMGGSAAHWRTLPLLRTVRTMSR